MYQAGTTYLVACPSGTCVIAFVEASELASRSHIATEESAPPESKLILLAGIPAMLVHHSLSAFESIHSYAVYAGRVRSGASWGGVSFKCTTIITVAFKVQTEANVWCRLQ